MSFFIDKKTIKERLSKLDEVINKLEECKKASKEDFLIDFRISDSAMHNLVLGIEIIFDIGNHILNEVFQQHPKEYKEIIEMLGECKVVPKKFAKENVNMAKFRNLIIHQYLKIDLNLVYDYLQKAPDIFRKFAKHFQKFLDKI
jgi:uncharacterized protein YutE (UPF0331/DUF86 family)